RRECTRCICRSTRPTSPRWRCTSDAGSSPTTATRTGPDRPSTVQSVDLDAEMDSLTIDQLRDRGSLKWTMPPDGAIGSFVAEMDFPMAAPIRAALDRALARFATGYLSPGHARLVAEACAEFQLSRFGWTVDPADVHAMSGVVHVSEVALRSLRPPGTPWCCPPRPTCLSSRCPPSW